MNILTVENITKAYGERKLFDKANFYLQEGEKAGIIGINGTGKSTLLKIIAGLEEPDEGRVVKANNTVIRFLPQNPFFLKEDTVLEAVLKDNKTAENESYIEADAKAMLTRLGVDNWDQPCGELSGGQKKRLALVSVLLSPAEILILDEPTNHLDNTMADWLEDTLRKRKGAVIMVTHDRYFLDSVSDRIIEIDKGHIYSYEANYSGYLELKLMREEMEEASQRKRETILRNELKWVQRGARARSTKQKARLQRYEELRNTQGPVKDGQVQLASISTRLGRTTVELEHICKSYGETVLIRDFSYIFLKDDRVGFIGRNGCGKSTLMKILTGQVELDSGHLEIGQTVKIGYYAQELGTEQMNPQKRVIDYIRDVAEYVDTPEGKVSAARMLERFLFTGEDQYGLLGKLSGGEKRRLYLLKVLMGAPNVLILDEPTNDLDIATLRILEDYLDTFEGIVIVVSHDRYFLDRTVRRIFAFEEDGRLVQYEGGYTDYAIRKEEEATGVSVAGVSLAGKGTGRDGGQSTGESSRTAWKDGQKKKLRFTYQEQKEYETIEGVIAKLEDTLEQIERKIPEAARDFVKLNELTMQKEETEKALEEKMERWMYLEDLAARIKAGEMI
ncbi:MAG: ABC-F family ATP-binding cassette domain-containing protein [Lachnospiraceae bacterium]|nr:ABC-F family ATP-binding cassette domain-containing protein [Lachnospiraceae bacterium]